MKKIITFLTLAIIMLAGTIGCSKKENKVYYEGSTAPVLTTSVTTTPALSVSTKANTAFVLNWTNPNYMFTTGVSSQNVTYTLQVDTTGANFSSPLRQEVSIASVLTNTVTVGTFNNYLIKLGLAPYVAHNIEMRIVANLSGAVPVYSNVIKYASVVPFEDFAVQPPTPPNGVLYVTGDATASGWVNTPPAAQKATKINNGLYTITLALTPGKYYKFLSSPGNWQPQYGGNNATTGSIGVNLGSGSDPDAIPTPTIAGNYKITMNFTLGTYTVEKL